MRGRDDEHTQDMARRLRRGRATGPGGQQRQPGQHEDAHQAKSSPADGGSVALARPRPRQQVTLEDHVVVVAGCDQGIELRAQRYAHSLNERDRKRERGSILVES